MWRPADAAIVCKLHRVYSKVLCQIAGETFEGGWQSGVREGAGAFRWPGGETLDGVWRKGTYVQGSSKAGKGTRTRDRIAQREGKEAHKALLQENDDLRANIRDLRGSEPLTLRRTAAEAKLAQYLPAAELRNENDRLRGVLEQHDHEKMVKQLNHDRKVAQACIAKMEGRARGERE